MSIISDIINDLKSNIYASLQNYKANDIHVNVTNKSNKILTDFEKSFSTIKMKEFNDNLREEQEQRGIVTAFNINVTSAYTVKALEGGNANRTDDTAYTTGEKPYEISVNEVLDSTSWITWEYIDFLK
ncbi:8004_t:CDS:2 [Funneliformis caledonium]|uniref:8004_t:CDS:1 n=1 Tax=Funneliformis caledonium TaxID=1117310 RepID=A0A9N9C695_9GLOM|nr:8004_t:CDS:2 [Funneliformis caledonium]